MSDGPTQVVAPNRQVRRALARLTRSARGRRMVRGDAPVCEPGCPFDGTVHAHAHGSAQTADGDRDDKPMVGSLGLDSPSPDHRMVG